VLFGIYNIDNVLKNLVQFNVFKKNTAKQAPKKGNRFGYVFQINYI